MDESQPSPYVPAGLARHKTGIEICFWVEEEKTPQRKELGHEKKQKEFYKKN